jgi:hypothetical protein
MERKLPLAEVCKLLQEGWEYENPPKPWIASKDDGKNETYIAGTMPSDPKLDALLNDPELKKIPDQVGRTPRSLLLMRELMLDRLGHHEAEED